MMTKENPEPASNLRIIDSFDEGEEQVFLDDFGTGERDYPIMVFSHLRWDWVWQRPQQFLTRLSLNHRVLFVEEPVFQEGLSEFTVESRTLADHPEITLVQSKFPLAWQADRSLIDLKQKEALDTVLTGKLAEEFAQPVLWFYDPMAVTIFVGQMNEIGVVYDCMDQLSQFRGAPPELVRRERLLVDLADVMFAGGPKIHESKREFNDNCHSYGCGVEIAHFGKAALPETEIPADVARLQGPVLGFFGAVDERMDYELLAAMADVHPDWQMVVVGPPIKVDPAAFPQRANLHWLGGRSYQELPGYVKAFDVCLMPFAINEATEFINPTKALEYMATGTPIVSTAIEDVILQFSSVVKIANSHAEFIALCEQSVASPDQNAIELGLEMAQLNSWEAIVERLEEHVKDALDSVQNAGTQVA